ERSRSAASFGSPGSSPRGEAGSLTRKGPKRAFRIDPALVFPEDRAVTKSIGWCRRMMSTRGFFFAFAIAAHNAFCVGATGAENTYGAAPGNLKDHLDRLMRSYPDQIAGHDTEFLVLKNGLKFRISDGRTNKTLRELLESPDIDDMFYSAYPLGAEPKQPETDADPGRVRFEPLFVAMYGDCNRNQAVDHFHP